MTPRCDSTLISLILLLATAAGAQEVSPNKRLDSREAGGKKEAKAPEVERQKSRGRGPIEQRNRALSGTSRFQSPGLVSPQ